MLSEERGIRYDGIHCNLRLEKFPRRVVVLKIRGTDVGEFGVAPMQVLDEWVNGSDPIDFFVDAREARGVSLDVSSEWAGWLNSHREVLRTVTMLTGSPLTQLTAEFVRRWASLEGVMHVCQEPSVFDTALARALRPQ